MSSTIAPKEVQLIISRKTAIPPALLSDEASGRQTVFELCDDGSTVTVGPVDARTLALLVTQSRFFENMFKWGFKESQLGSECGDFRRIRLDNISFQVFHILLSFARTFRLPAGLDDDSAWELRNYAHYFDWDLLEAACEELIATRLKPESVCAIWTVAEKCNASTLAEMCLKYFTDNFSLSSMSPSFFMLQKPLLKRALDSGNINCDAKVIFNALNTWARFQHHANASSRGAPFDALTYIGDLLPPCTLFNSRTKAAIMGGGSMMPFLF